MKCCRDKTGLTLVEILTVVAVLAILVSTVITVALRSDQQAKEQLMENTVAMLSAALKEFGEYGYEYREAYARHRFPPDCTDFGLQFGLQATLEEALGKPVNIRPPVLDDPNYSGIESMYFFLNRVVETRVVLEEIDKSLLTNRDARIPPGNVRTFIVDGKPYPLVRIIDAWGTVLRYEYDAGGYLRTFPVITSAGPDRRFETEDDNITNR